jgi:hypothetical protein
MLTAVAALLIASIVGGVFGSIATYTYVDNSEGKYCERISDNVISEENDEFNYMNEDGYQEQSEEDLGNEEY